MLDAFQKFAPGPEGRQLQSREVEPDWAFQTVNQVVQRVKYTNSCEGVCQTDRGTFRFVRYDDNSLRTKQTLTAYAMWNEDSNDRFWGVTDRLREDDDGTGVSFEQMLHNFSVRRPSDFEVKPSDFGSSQEFVDMRKNLKPQQFFSHAEGVY